MHAGGDLQKQEVTVAACYSYSRSRGLFAGISLEARPAFTPRDRRDRDGQTVCGTITTH